MLALVNSNHILLKMGKKVFVFFILVQSFLYVPAQAQAVHYWVQFSDKNNSPYSLENAHIFLSQKSLERRAAQGIKIDSSDVPVSPAYLAGIKKTGAKIINTSKWINGVVITSENTSTIEAIKALSFVIAVKPLEDTPIISSSSSKFSKESFIPFEAGELSSYNKTANYNYGPSFNQINMISGDSLHNMGLTGEGKIIAMLDAGFYNVNTLAAFDSLRLNNQILGTWDFATGNSSVYEDDAHGMMTLSVIAANLPGQLVGTAPKASFWLLRTEVVASESLSEEYNWAAAAEFADSVGVDIISSSLGYNTFDNSAQNHTYADMNGNTTPITIAADKAAAKGILVIVSAGNEGNNPWHYILAPADGDSVMAVGAVDANKVRAVFSSVGPSYDRRIKPNVAAQGVNTVLASSNGGTLLGNGTSFACPIIAGMAACLWQGNPSLTNMEILHLIEKSCDHYNTPDSLTGFGIPNFVVANTMLTAGKNIESLQIYPNPFFNDLKFSFYSQGGDKIVIEIYDAIGKRLLISEKDVSANKINYMEINELSRMNNGIYLLKLSMANKSYIHKIIKY